jgi:hypothetical protein
MASLEIDDFEALHSKPDLSADEERLIVGATKGDPVRHPLEHGPVHRLVWIREDVTDYAAH